MQHTERAARHDAQYSHPVPRMAKPNGAMQKVDLAGLSDHVGYLVRRAQM
jgi:hypothetical protein